MKGTALFEDRGGLGITGAPLMFIWLCVGVVASFLWEMMVSDDDMSFRNDVGIVDFQCSWIC